MKQSLSSRVKRYLKRKIRQTRRKIKQTRPSTEIIKRHFHQKPIVGCEVGVFQADNAKNMLDNLPNLKTLYLVDPYDEYEGYVPFGPRVDSRCLSKAQKVAKEILEPYSDRVIWIQDQFKAALIPQLLDFIYIDGNHSYKAVMHDIHESEKIVKHGGIISGHDYYPEGTHNINDVGRAVRDRYGAHFNHKEEDWWIIFHKEVKR